MNANYFACNYTFVVDTQILSAFSQVLQYPINSTFQIPSFLKYRQVPKLPMYFVWKYFHIQDLLLTCTLSLKKRLGTVTKYSSLLIEPSWGRGGGYVCPKSDFENLLFHMLRRKPCSLFVKRDHVKGTALRWVVQKKENIKQHLKIIFEF